MYFEKDEIRYIESQIGSKHAKKLTQTFEINKYNLKNKKSNKHYGNRKEN